MQAGSGAQFRMDKIVGTPSSNGDPEAQPEGEDGVTSYFQHMMLPEFLPRVCKWLSSLTTVTLHWRMIAAHTSKRRRMADTERP